MPLCPKNKGKKCKCKKKGKKRCSRLKMVGNDKPSPNPNKVYSGIQKRPIMPDHPALRFM